MDKFSFSICMDFVGQAFAFGFLAFAVIGISLDTMMKKRNAPSILRSSVVSFVALAIAVPLVVFLIYTPFSAVKVAADHLEVEYVWPRFSERIAYQDLSSVNVDNEVHPTKMSSFATSTLVILTKNQRSLRSFDMRNNQPGSTPAEQAETAIRKASSPMR